MKLTFENTQKITLHIQKCETVSHIDKDLRYYQIIFRITTNVALEF